MPTDNVAITSSRGNGPKLSIPMRIDTAGCQLPATRAFFHGVYARVGQLILGYSVQNTLFYRQRHIFVPGGWTRGPLQDLDELACQRYCLPPSFPTERRISAVGVDTLFAMVYLLTPPRRHRRLPRLVAHTTHFSYSGSSLFFRNFISLSFPTGKRRWKISWRSITQKILSRGVFFQFFSSKKRSEIFSPTFGEVWE